MNIYTVYKPYTPEQKKLLVELFNQVANYKCIENFGLDADMDHWDSVFISSASTEQYEPEGLYKYILFLGNEAYASSSECTVKYEKIALDDFISQVKSIILDLSLES